MYCPSLVLNTSSSFGSPLRCHLQEGSSGCPSVGSPQDPTAPELSVSTALSILWFALPHSLQWEVPLGQRGISFLWDLSQTTGQAGEGVEN